MRERLQAADYRFIVVCLTLLAAATWYSAGNFYRAFPEASIDFRVDRGDAQHLAEKFLASQGLSVEGYRDASSFTFDDDAKTFLEREAGLEKANQLMGSRIRLWRWSFRWFLPQQKEEYRADVTPAGEVVAFTHELAEDAARPAISLDAARRLAEDFLRIRVHRDPASLDFIDSSSLTRPHRTDHVFTWKERDFELHDATSRVSVTILGDEVGGYNEFLKVPEQWTRDYQRLRSKNNEAQTFDTLAMVALLIGLIFVLVTRVRRQDIRWRRSALIGVAAMVLSFLSSLNQFPLEEFGYTTTDAYSSFLVQRLLEALLQALAWGGALFVIAAGAETLYREAFPEKVSLGHLFSRRGLRTKRFFLGTILGVTLCAIFIAYQTIFYIFAYRYGAWSPADVPYSDLLNTRFPWLFVLIGGYLPAVSEEFLFRMFAIPFLRKLVKWMPAAIVLAGFIWGFGHAGYPQQPFFIRGLEVGIGGIALGLIMLRWGILPTLVWHYSVDAMYSAMLLLRSHSLYFKLSGAASAGIFVLPIAVALIAYWRRGGFEPETGLLNGDEPKPIDIPAEHPLQPESEAAPHWRLSNRMRLIAVAVLIGGMISVAIPTDADFGHSPAFQLDAAKARTVADAFLRAQSVDPGSYLHVTFAAVHWGGEDSLAGKYFFEHLPISAASRLFAQNRPVRYWSTRYFKSLEKEEFLVTVNPETGKVTGYNHQLPEDRPGADLTPEAAREIAANFAAAQGLDTSSMDLKESSAEKRKARRDYSLVWEARPGDPRNVQEARYRVEVGVDGDRVGSWRGYWKVPEAFERERSQQNFISILVLALKISVMAAGLVFVMWALIGRIREGLVPWRRALKMAILPAAMTVITLVLSVQLTIYRGYQTVMPFETFVITTVAVLAIGAAFSFVMYAAASAFLLSFFPESIAALRTSNRRVLGLDAGILLLLALGLWHIWLTFHGVLTGTFHQAAIIDVDTPMLTDIHAPALAALANAIRSVFLRAAILGAMALAIRRLPKRWMLVPAALLAVFALISDDVRTPAELLLEYTLGLAVVALALTFCLIFARRNYLAYALVLALVALHPGLSELLHSGNPGLETQGWIVAAALIGWIGWVVVPGLMGNKTGQQAG